MIQAFNSDERDIYAPDLLVSDRFMEQRRRSGETRV